MKPLQNYSEEILIPPWLFEEPEDDVDKGSEVLGNLDFEEEDDENEDSEDTTKNYSKPPKSEKNLRLLCRAIKKRVKQNLDAVICISGEEGSGKSHLALRMAELLAYKFDFEDHVIAFPEYERVKKKVNTLPKYSPLVLDEAILTMYKRNFAKKDQISINQMFNLCRKKNLIFLICLPRFSDLDSYFRDHRVLLSIVIPSALDTGIAVVHRRDDNPYNVGEKWHFKESYEMTGGNKKNKMRFDKYKDSIERVMVMSRTPNYMMSVRFGFDKSLDRRYNNFLKKHQRELEDFQGNQMQSTDEELNKARLEKSIMLLATSGIDKDVIAKSLDLPKTIIARTLGKGKITSNDIKLGKLKAQMRDGIITDLHDNDDTQNRRAKIQGELVDALKEAKYDTEKLAKAQKEAEEITKTVVPTDEKALKVKELFS